MQNIYKYLMSPAGHPLFLRVDLVHHLTETFPSNSS